MSTAAPVLPSVHESAPAVKYLTFTLGDAGFGVALSRVREIVGFVDIVPLPSAPSGVKGVINLRGRSIRVVDMRGKLGLPHSETADLSCIVVLEIGTAEHATHIGMIVDGVTEVLTLAQGQPAVGRTLLDPDQLLIDLIESTDNRTPSPLAA